MTLVVSLVTGFIIFLLIVIVGLLANVQNKLDRISKAVGILDE